MSDVPKVVAVSLLCLPTKKSNWLNRMCARLIVSDATVCGMVR